MKHPELSSSSGQLHKHRLSGGDGALRESAPTTGRLHKRSLSLALLLLLLLTIVQAFANEPPPVHRITPMQLIFKTSRQIQPTRGRTGLAQFDGFLAQLGADNIRLIQGMHLQQYYLVDLEQEPDWDVVRSGSYRFEGIEYIQPNGLSTFHNMTPNDPMYPLQQLHLSSIPQAWNYSTGSPLVVVGVVDSGLLLNHPDITANLYINPHEIPDNGIDDDGNGYIDDWCGWDFVDAPEMADVALGDFTGQDTDVTDENYHGTHVSGILGAVGNNQTGITGVCWMVRIMPLRAGFRTTQGTGYLQDDDAAAAIIYAADNGSHVINMSWGDPNYSPIIADACEYAFNKGVVLVGSAGNDPGPYLSYPAKLSTVISAGAVNRYKQLAGFSSYGVDLDLTAPGEQIWSTYKLEPPELYSEMSGTSMSAPYVTGSVALLLGLQPGLTPDEVRSRLLTSTDDLGTPGFDIYYGHGLLNTRKLLENLDPPVVGMDFPFDNMGVAASFDITGSVQSADFFRYSVMYTNKPNPSILDWKDVNRHTNQPAYYHEPVINGLIARFVIPDHFKDGAYLLRIQYESNNGKRYNYYRTIHYTTSYPTMIIESVQGFKRYEGQNMRYYVSAKFSETVHARLTVIAADLSEHFVYSITRDSIQVWLLPPEIPQGQVSVQIDAYNNANLNYSSPLIQDVINVQYEIIPSHGWSFDLIGPPRVPLNKTYDFDNNGMPEYVSMDLPSSGYGQVYVYEPTPDGHVQKHSFNDSFWPYDIGNTNAGGIELLILKADTAIILETPAGSNYPSQNIWSATSISGGTFANYLPGQPADEVLLVQNLPTERVIQAYTRSGDTFIARNVLRNLTDTALRNTFVPSVICRNLDNDAYPDILAADTDGDLMTFEILNNNNHSMTWTRRMPVGNTYYLTSGDFNGDSRQEFLAGGYYRDILNPNLNFWYFEGFARSANNTYTSMGSIMINNYMSQNAAHSYDLDNDGKDEIILALTPNLYILKYVDNQFKPIWYGTSSSTYQIAAWRDATQHSYFLTNFKTAQDSLFAVEWKQADAFTGPPTPPNLIVKPRDERSASIAWTGNNADFYIVHRKDEEGNIVDFTGITQHSFTDSTLVSGKTYQYCLSAYNGLFQPPESQPTLWQSVIPMPHPRIVQIALVSNNELRILFDQQMAAQNLIPGYFHVSHGMGHPHSVNATMMQYGMQLKFRDQFFMADAPFVLTMSNVVGATGVEPEIWEYNFFYNPDTVSPAIVEVTVGNDKRSVEIRMSEDIATAEAMDISNYVLTNPLNDPSNRIVSIGVSDNMLSIRLEHPLKYSNQLYYVTVSNVTDLAGNVISPQFNTARFSLPPVTDLSQMILFPNPVRSSEQAWLGFLNLPLNKPGKIRIYNAAGDIVWDSEIPPLTAVTHNTVFRWDLKNSSGHKVSSGIYYFILEMGGEYKKGKFAIIN
ncbi:MAG: S8 family serine peptidase [Candidatus Cloacimonetes bacterium]|nr:S8 family serine peptidase [Candidatus Cloacimonadota bacterium]